MRGFFIAIIIFCASLCDAQNLLLNPSFEDTIVRIASFHAPTHWTTPTTGSPDLMTPYNLNNRSAPQNFAGYQFAHSGNNYMGMLIYRLFYGSGGNPLLREYIQNDISPALQQDSMYCLQLFVSLADSLVHASKNKLGVYFSTTRIQSNNSNYLPYTPQIMVSPDSFITEKQAWLEYNFQYKAAGGERYITIGNFSDSSSVDTIFVGGGVRSDPNNLGTYYYLDDIYLGSCDSVPVYTSVGLPKENILEQQIRVYPNPTAKHVFISYSGSKKLEYRLFNLVGQATETRQLQSGTSTTLSDHNKIQISVGHLPKGIYLLEIMAGEERITKKIVKE